ncbi:WecB/TagA/CpsF family glycosyltransferase [Stappia sp. TSB10GB4]|uniref:WecB/TagA/CpsF family glycosyltransferase n=1 Tax=Stappia sp. TSB10GB4 TaxID=2003584 RepID=UPI0016453944|nr:WecB/TagA/CpsF family glycosyltransferase [Stappia sp. TSB10GB4]
MEFSFPPYRIAITHADAAALLEEVSARLRRGEGFALATINLDHLAKLRCDEAFRAAYAAQDLVVADGNPVVWLSRLAGRPVSLVPGSDMVVPMAEAAAQAGVGVALLGATPAALDAAAEALTARVPRLAIVARLAPPMGFDPNGAGADALIDELARSGARLCFLALGAPKQEIFAARAHRRLPQVGFASIGAGLDFLAGTQRRAPAWMRAAALEWLWRMLSNPARLVPRYVRSALTLPGQAVAAWRLRRR